MRVLITQHHPDEGAGTLAGFLAGQGCELDERHLYRGDGLPADAAGYGLVVSMGGPMNVYEEDKYAWLAPETEFLGRALRAEVPVVGICLGAQLMAKALGAQVVRSPQPEVGWASVRLNDAGQTDPLLAGAPREMTVFQWHGDMFEVPDGGVLLAESDACPRQAFRWGRGYALQFHVEVTSEIVEKWYEDQAQAEAVRPGWQGPGLEMRRQAELIYRNLWSLLHGQGHS